MVSGLVRALPAACLFLFAGSPAAGQDLSGTVWMWEKPPPVASGLGVAAQTASLRFVDGNLIAFLGCNTAGGSYAYAADGSFHVTIGPATKMLCANPLYEQKFAQALEDATHLSRKDAALVLTNDSGAIVLRLLLH